MSAGVAQVITGVALPTVNAAAVDVVLPQLFVTTTVYEAASVVVTDVIVYELAVAPVMLVTPLVH